MRKQTLYVLLLGVLLCAVLLTGCSSEPDKQATQKQTQPPRKIIIDTDTGGDDAAALILAAKSENVEILGVTTLVGNVDLAQSTRNALAALEIAGNSAPVYNGASKTIAGKEIHAFSVYGEDGMGDADLVHPKGKAQEKDAVSFLIDTVKANPGEVEIVSIGPATNIARALQKAPEEMKKVKRIWSMGTAGQGPGNATPVAEFNTYHDAEAYRIMLDSGLPVTVIGLDVTDGKASWTKEQFQQLEETNEIGRFVTKSFQKIREFYIQNRGLDETNNCDATAMMCVVQPDFVQDTVQAHGSCLTEDGETYGQVIFYQKGFTYDVAKNDFDYNVTLVTRVDGAHFFDRYREAIQG